MTRDRRSEAVRDLQRPKPITFVELFFDLVYVFSLFRLSEMLTHRLHWVGAAQTLLVLMAIWWVWAYTNLLTDTMDSRAISLQLLVIGSMFGALALSTAIPETFEHRGLLFVVSYLAINLGRASIMAFVLRHDELGLRPLRAVFWFAVSAVPWLAGAFVEGDARFALWGLAITIDYVCALIGWPAPGIGRTPARELNLASEHFAERYRQFIIIALGQTVAVSGLAFHNSDFTAHRGVAFVMSFAITVLLYWIYFHRIRERLAPSFAGAPDPRVRPREAGLAHLVMVAGVVATTTATGTLIAEPTGTAPPFEVAVFVAGPVLFLAGHALLGRHEFVGVAAPRLAGILALVAAAPVLAGHSVVLLAGSIVAILAGVVAWDLVHTGVKPGDQDLPRRL
ncbi:low temperature requirement protein A [Plantactinospora sp. CA-294935]|uniref:low temperature requirement protein A n=1 Tax=Plantactinospora sp. CA-294935 TaxID=3240012 RepID=UPI003D9271AC